MVKTLPTLLVNEAYKTGLTRKYSSRMNTARLLTVHVLATAHDLLTVHVGTHPSGPVFEGGWVPILVRHTHQAGHTHPWKGHGTGISTPLERI